MAGGAIGSGALISVAGIEGDAGVVDKAGVADKPGAVDKAGAATGVGASGVLAQPVRKPSKTSRVRRGGIAVSFTNGTVLYVLTVGDVLSETWG